MDHSKNENLRVPPGFNGLRQILKKICYSVRSQQRLTIISAHPPGQSDLWAFLLIWCNYGSKPVQRAEDDYFDLTALMYIFTQVFLCNHSIITFFLTNLSQQLSGNELVLSTSLSHCALMSSSPGCSAIHRPSNSNLRAISFSLLKITSGT